MISPIAFWLASGLMQMLEHSNSLARFEDQDVEDVVREELNHAVAKYQARLHPVAILLAGQPGAGKTELSSMLIHGLEGKAVFINGDDYRRFHPHYRELYREFGPDSVQMLSPFSNRVTERLIDEFSDCNVNMVIEGTGRTVKVPQSTAELLTGKGYTVEMAVIAVKPEISLISTLRRFYQMNERGTIPRATAIGVHDAIVDVLPGNLDQLNQLPSIVRLTIWDREMTLLFDSRANVDLLPSEVLRKSWYRTWTAEELQQAKRDIRGLWKQERQSRLGQGPAIDELAQRIDAVEKQIQALGQTML